MLVSPLLPDLASLNKLATRVSRMIQFLVVPLECWEPQPELLKSTLLTVLSSPV